MLKLPRLLTLPNGKEISVTVGGLSKPERHNGIYDSAGIIRIGDDLDQPEAVAILIHELMHAVEHEMKECGALNPKAQVPHDFIHGFSYAAVSTLGRAGMLSCVSKRAARRFEVDSREVRDWTPKE